MNQFELKDNQLILKVKKSPLLGRLILYLITFLSIVLPLGVLVIKFDDDTVLETVTNIPLSELESLISSLKKINCKRL